MPESTNCFLLVIRLPLLILISLTCLSVAAQEPHQLQPQTNNRRSEKYPIEYRPITPRERLVWFARSTVGGTSFVGGLFSSGLGTAIDTPSEYGTHWEGFGKRYGMRLTGISAGNAMEAALGAAWGEDPRYFSVNHSPFGSRVKNVVDLTFRAYQADGERHLAYARYAATFGNNALSNTWRAPSEADWQHALVRTAEGFGVHALSNTFREFLPQAVRKLRH